MAKQSEFRIVGAVSTPRGVFRAGDEAAAAQALSAEEVSGLRERGILVDAGSDPSPASIAAGGSARGRAMEPDAPAVAAEGDVAAPTTRVMGTASDSVEAETPATATTKPAAKSAAKKGGR